MAYAIVNIYEEAGRQYTKHAVPVGPDGRDADGVKRVGDWP